MTDNCSVVCIVVPRCKHLLTYGIKCPSFMVKPNKSL